jgi:hypothetical protein
MTTYEKIIRKKTDIEADYLTELINTIGYYMV